MVFDTSQSQIVVTNRNSGEILPRAAGSSGIVPSAVANLDFWLDAQTLVGADGSSVSSWNDSTANGRNVAAAGSTNPVLKTGVSAFGGKQVVRFDGSSQRLENTTWPVTGSGAVTVALVMKAAAITAATHGAIILGRSASNNAILAGGFYNGATGQFTATDRGTGFNLTAPVLGTTVPYVIIIRGTNNSTNEFFINGTLASNPTSFSWNHNITTNGFNVGGWPTEATQHNGDIAEVAVWSRAISDTELAGVTAYWRSKYSF